MPLIGPGTDEAGEAGGQAVDAERSKGSVLEVLRQEPDRQVGSDSGQDAADEDLAVDVPTERPEEVRQLEDARREDDRRRQQERGAGGVLVVQTAQQAGRHRHTAPADARRQCSDLSTADQDPPAERQVGECLIGVAQRRSPARHGICPTDGPRARGHPHRSLSSKPFTHQQDQPVDRQEQTGGNRLGQHRSEGVFQQQTRDTDWDRGENQQPAESLCRRLDPTVPDRGEQPSDDAHPVAPEEHDERESGRDVQTDDERQVRRLGAVHLQVLGPLTADHSREEDAVPEAGHREQLGDALKQPDNGSLRITQKDIRRRSSRHSR